ncbi:patatin-like phospholipase family protein [Thalassotalea mangrovi]|uniref:Patatin-like phospholipase family protein n=1 Tax=Thalassotalea mangrovi TaxID=2572245 RepID=A0A4U1B2G4_9GAMM|nr:patatin-like phospholipase family protein [Thalassotalea mangrovi]TKB43630.1 patatin-like phospholipase family protein [Thalassotalea mangrovi]
MLDIYAGKNALATLQQQGFSQQLISTMIGASGGPKWFSLFGLDKYIFGELFKDRTSELNLIGSSAGAFRFAALSQSDPVAGITRLAENYSQTVYSEKADAKEITSKAYDLMSAVFGENGIEQIITNPVYKAHFVTCRCHGLTQFENKALQMLGLVTSYGLNRIDRRLLKHQFQRVIYHHPESNLTIKDPYQFETSYLPLTENNTLDALLASGSIPVVMQGIRNIADSPKGMYRDGGIVDYHFDLELENQQGLILYPHFSPVPKAGWFDKSLNRFVDKKHYDNVIMLVPSAEFIASLPHQKIPDRKDFTDFPAPERIKNWQTVLSATEQLAQSLDDFLHKQDIERVKPLAW